MPLFERVQRVVSLCHLAFIHLQPGAGEARRRTARFVVLLRQVQVTAASVRVPLPVSSLRRTQVVDQRRPGEGGAFSKRAFSVRPVAFNQRQQPLVQKLLRPAPAPVFGPAPKIRRQLNQLPQQAQQNITQDERDDEQQHEYNQAGLDNPVSKGKHHSTGGPLQQPAQADG